MQLLNLMIIVFLLIIIPNVNSQVIYVDPTTTAALATYSSTLKAQQEQTIKEQKKLQKTQAFVSTQVANINRIQGYVYTGLKEISGTVHNAVQVKNIYSDLEVIYRYTEELRDLIKENPEYAVFGTNATKRLIEESSAITSHLTELLTESDLNLATAGDRYKLLFNIEDKTKLLRVYVISITLKIKRAVRLGFWQSINPFQSYVNTDKTIVENTIAKYERNF